MLLRYILFVPILVSINALPCLAEDSITIIDSAAGSFSADGAETTYKRDINGHWMRATRSLNQNPYTSLSELFKPSLSDKDVQQLIQTFKDSKKQSSLNLLDLGITKESVKAHHNKLVEDVKGFEPDLLKSMPDKYSSFFDFPNIAKTIEDSLYIPTDSTTDFEKPSLGSYVYCKISNPSSGTIEAISCGNNGWMLPWSIKQGKEIWHTYSLSIPKAIKALATQNGPNANNNYVDARLDGSKYWQKDFWEYDIAPKLEEQINQRAAIEMSRSWQGYERASKKFELLGVDLSQGSISNIQVCQLRLHLKPKQSALIDTVVWGNYTDNKQKPKSNWNDLLIEYQKSLAVIQRFPWLIKWKDSNPVNGIALQVFSVLNCPTIEEIESWKDANLHDCPKIQLQLTRNGQWCDAYLSDKENTAIVIPRFCMPIWNTKKPTHWLDKINTDSASSDWRNKYILVKSNGEHEIRTVPGPIKW